MSSLIRPFLKDRPISATIRVDRDTIRSPELETRVFSRVARNSAGDLWTLRYTFNLPTAILLHDSRRRVFLVYQPGEPEPAVTPCRSDPIEPPAHFPLEAPNEPPAVLSGIPCLHRRWTSELKTEEVWYSYEYAAAARIVLTRKAYGTTVWYLDEVKLEEPRTDIFGEASILASDSEREQNLRKVAADVFARFSRDASSR